MLYNLVVCEEKFEIFQEYLICPVLFTKTYINNRQHLAQKYARIFVRGLYLFREANSFPRAKLKENCELGEYSVT